jgi:hypothetical protein
MTRKKFAQLLRVRRKDKSMYTPADIRVLYPKNTKVEIVSLHEDSQPKDLFGEITNPVKPGSVGFVDSIYEKGQIALFLSNARRVILTPNVDTFKLIASPATFEEAIEAYENGKTVTMEFIENREWYAGMAFKKNAFDSSDMIPSFTEWKNAIFLIHQEG